MLPRVSALLSDGAWEQSLEMLQAMPPLPRKEHKERARHQSLVGQCHEGLQRWEDAEAAYRKAIKLAPKVHTLFCTTQNRLWLVHADPCTRPQQSRAPRLALARVLLREVVGAEVDVDGMLAVAEEVETLLTKVANCEPKADNDQLPCPLPVFSFAILRYPCRAHYWPICEQQIKHD